MAGMTLERLEQMIKDLAAAVHELRTMPPQQSGADGGAEAEKARLSEMKFVANANGAAMIAWLALLGTAFEELGRPERLVWLAVFVLLGGGMGISLRQLSIESKRSWAVFKANLTGGDASDYSAGCRADIQFWMRWAYGVLISTAVIVLFMLGYWLLIKCHSF